jgi:hypothetical protein
MATGTQHRSSRCPHLRGVSAKRTASKFPADSFGEVSEDGLGTSAFGGTPLRISSRAGRRVRWSGIETEALMGHHRSLASLTSRPWYFL